MNRTEELEDQVRQLNSTVDEMKARMDRLEGAEPADKNGTKRSSRRGFLRLGAAAALGSMGWVAAKAMPVSAADGGTFTLGQANLAASPTTVKGDIETGVGPPTPVLAAIDSTFVQGPLTTAGGFLGALQGLGSGAGGNPIVEGVDGWASGTKAFAVYGLTDSGTGVTGESSTGIGLYARSSGRIRQDGLVLAGMPAPGANDFEQVRDAAGAMWISTPGGAGWKQVATTDLGFHIFPNPRRVYNGFAQPTAPGTYGPVDATTQVYPTVAPSGVPAGAQAAFCAVQSYSAGVLSIYPDLTSNPQIANWSGTANGPLNLLYMFVPLSPAGKFLFTAYFTGIRVFDVWGYLM
jgi:hypothetical protein